MDCKSPIISLVIPTDTGATSLMEERHLDVCNGPFARGALNMATQLLDLLRYPPSDKNSGSRS